MCESLGQCSREEDIAFCWLSRLILEVDFHTMSWAMGPADRWVLTVDHSEPGSWVVGRPRGSRRNPTGPIPTLSRGGSDRGLWLPADRAESHSSSTDPNTALWSAQDAGAGDALQQAGEKPLGRWRDSSHSLLSPFLREPDTGTLLIITPDIYTVSELRALLLILFSGLDPHRCTIAQITHPTGSL